MSLRIALFAGLLSVSAPTFAQDALPAPSGQWQADEKQNAKLFKRAESDFKAAMKARRAQFHADHGEDGPPGGDMPGGGGPPPGGGMGGPRGGGMGGPPGGPHGGMGRGGEPGLAGLLPAELAFAAPANGMLIVQRLHDAVAFAQDGDDAVTLIPLTGDAIDLGNGVKAKAGDDGGALVLDATTSSGLHVQYRYLMPAESPGGLEVRIVINGRMAENLQLARVYRRADVKVGAIDTKK